MVQKTRNYTYQYILLFYLSWICLYLIFPAWMGSHTFFQGKDLLNFSNPSARSLVILGFIIYFSISAYLINRYLGPLILDKPVIVKPDDWFKKIKNNVWIVIVCCVAAILHIGSFFLPEVGYLRQVVWLYDFSDRYWRSLFDIPIQYGFWSAIILLILIIRQKKTINSISSYISRKKSNNLLKVLFLFSLFVLFTLYSYLFPYSKQDAFLLLRFPPVSKSLYLMIYYAFGVSQAGPRILQLVFYVLSAVYLYRTIQLFGEKETALLGATIYLFSPIIFIHASLPFFASGTVFFMVLISFYFLRFIKDNDSRDLVLTAFFLGIGFMYKRSLLLMLVICFAYIVLIIMIKRDWKPVAHLKVLLLSLVLILPWLKIGPGVYKAIWTNLITLDELIVYAVMIQDQFSWVMFLLFLASIGFVLLSKHDDLLRFFGLYFVAYYFFFTLMEAGEINHRYAMALYPAIAVFISRFIFIITQRIRWKHSFKLASAVLSIYLIFLCLVPRSSSDLITFKYKDFEIQHYPIDEVTDWVRDKTTNERILTIMPHSYGLYLDRFYADKEKINRKRFVHYHRSMVKELIYPFEKLIEYCYAEKISYIMFPFGPNNYFPDIGASEEVRYLKENMNKEFTEVAKLNYIDNYILVYKLKEKVYD